MQRMKRGKNWEKLANKVARAFCPPMRSCGKCGGPYITGYDCTRCGDTDPSVRPGHKGDRDYSRRL